MRATLWKLPFEDENQDLLDDSSIQDLVKLADLGTDQHGDIKWFSIADVICIS